MPVETVQLGVSAIRELMDNGYTWNKKDDLGFGSIQEKYQASEMQIAAIRKHPLLKDLETTARIFVIIDDTVKTVMPPVPARPAAVAETPVAVSPAAVSETVSDDDSFSAFANL